MTQKEREHIGKLFGISFAFNIALLLLILGLFGLVIILSGTVGELMTKVRELS